MLRKEKTAVVDELRKKLEAAKSLFLTDFTGVNVKDISSLRNSFREASIEYLVAKNTLIKRAVADTPLDQLNPFLTGPTSLVISGDDGVEAAKIITRFVKDKHSFEVKVGVISEHLVDSGQVKNIAALPAREVLLAQLLGTINAPVANLVFILNETAGRVVRVLGQVRDARQSQEKN
ncbi:MAG: 50S ribosomal protein L10 [Gemmatimonadota bacterium]|nr:50S ribosomal protein L10 [Gemmatimonadota bacterium]